MLLVIGIIDTKYKIIHNKSSLLTLLIGFVLQRKLYITGLFVALIILLICVFVDEKYKGGGDIKFIGVIGLLKGFNFTMEFYIISEILCFTYRKIKRKNKTEQLAYAPFMFLAFLLKII
ncbi:prepilin peptidase [[Clostridium] colinum]|uniref:prepilin peptidase n=1 Tax=[Clostridium] colinum TaxID=36835 RepID=UPI0020249407